VYSGQEFLLIERFKKEADRTNLRRDRLYGDIFAASYNGDPRPR
jgi:hypothetical protein